MIGSGIADTWAVLRGVEVKPCPGACQSESGWGFYDGDDFFHVPDPTKQPWTWMRLFDNVQFESFSNRIPGSRSVECTLAKRGSVVISRIGDSHEGAFKNSLQDWMVPARLGKHAVPEADRPVHDMKQGRLR